MIPNQLYPLAILTIYIPKHHSPPSIFVVGATCKTSICKWCHTLSVVHNIAIMHYRLCISCLLSMVQSPSWEANWFAASQEIPRISRNPKVHYRIHKHPPPVSILGQTNPVHRPTSHLLEIHSNIIQPSTPRSPQWSPSLRFPHQDPIHPPLPTHTRRPLLRMEGNLLPVSHPYWTFGLLATDNKSLGLSAWNLLWK